MRGGFFWKSTLRLRFIHFLSAFYLEILIKHFFGIKYQQSKKIKKLEHEYVYSKQDLYTNVRGYIGRKKTNHI